jgi:hypothetical protein
MAAGGRNASARHDGAARADVEINRRRCRRCGLRTLVWAYAIGGLNIPKYLVKAFYNAD